MTGAPGFAPAKINLALHVTGRRPDGFHLLDSLVAFADVGDVVSAHPAADLSLRVIGPEAADLSGDGDNLVLRAARWLGHHAGARLTLEKNLPVASGIGGGSSDAAATVRVLCAMWRRPLPDPADLVDLGADVPVCLRPRTLRMRGIGEVLLPAPPLPPVWVALVNPRVALATAGVFDALGGRVGSPLPERLPQVSTASDLAEWLGGARNDLQAAATAIAPAVGDAVAALAEQPGCLLARMSGSGATCFGLFPDPLLAIGAASAIRRDRPAWWVVAARLGATPA